MFKTLSLIKGYIEYKSRTCKLVRIKFEKVMAILKIEQCWLLFITGN